MIFFFKMMMSSAYNVRDIFSLAAETLRFTVDSGVDQLFILIW